MKKVILCCGRMCQMSQMINGVGGSRMLGSRPSVCICDNSDARMSVLNGLKEIEIKGYL